MCVGLPVPALATVTDPGLAFAIAIMSAIDFNGELAATTNTSGKSTMLQTGSKLVSGS